MVKVPTRPVTLLPPVPMQHKMVPMHMRTAMDTMDMITPVLLRMVAQGMLVRTELAP